MEMRLNVNRLKKTNTTETLKKKSILNSIFIIYLKDFLLLQNKLQSAFMNLLV